MILKCKITNYFLYLIIKWRFFYLFSLTLHPKWRKQYIANTINLSGKVVGLRREEHLEIPVEALREALTNSLCHRRYDDPRASVSLAIYDDRLEIVNPGCFTNGLTPENIKDSHESFPYNHLIAQVLYLSTYLESWGSGVRRMIELCHEQGLPEPEYQSDGYTVKIVFWKSAQKKEEAKHKELFSKIKKFRKVLSYLN